MFAKPTQVCPMGYKIVHRSWCCGPDSLKRYGKEQEPSTAIWPMAPFRVSKQSLQAAMARFHRCSNRGDFLIDGRLRCRPMEAVDLHVDPWQ